jgi:hypothetical protein
MIEPEGAASTATGHTGCVKFLSIGGLGCIRGCGTQAMR